MAKATAFAAAVGTVVTLIWGGTLGGAVQAAVVAAAALIVAVSVHEHHATIRNRDNAAVAAGAQQAALNVVSTAPGLVLAQQPTPVVPSPSAPATAPTV